MEGITILNMYVHEGYIKEPWAILFLGLVIFGGVGIVGFMMLHNAYFDKVWPIVLCVFCVFFLFVGFGVSIFAPREETTYYQITIDDSVNFNEFIEHYKIIEQNGLIYTVEERECNTG